MKIIIEHDGVKREIKGLFRVCLGENDLKTMIQCLSQKHEEKKSYGWIDICERPIPGLDLRPLSWKK